MLNYCKIIIIDRRKLAHYEKFRAKHDNNDL